MQPNKPFVILEDVMRLGQQILQKNAAIHRFNPAKIRDVWSYGDLGLLRVCLCPPLFARAKESIIADGSLSSFYSFLKKKKSFAAAKTTKHLALVTLYCTLAGQRFLSLSSDGRNVDRCLSGPGKKKGRRPGMITL